MVKFSKRVLTLVKKIPRSKVTTYKLIAQKLNSKAYRAVGAALKSNKNPIKIPCHRVISSGFSLGGYQGKPNSPKKAELLRKEGVKIEKGKVPGKYLFLF